MTDEGTVGGGADVGCCTGSPVAGAFAGRCAGATPSFCVSFAASCASIAWLCVITPGAAVEPLMAAAVAETAVCDVTAAADAAAV